MASSVIARFTYDEPARLLTIWFQSGDCYSYADVDPFTVEAFRRAPSQGRFFAARIRDRYKAQWIPGG